MAVGEIEKPKPKLGELRPMLADDVVAGLHGRLVGLSADTPDGYEAVRSGIAECRTLRSDVERSRKALKESALEWGRKVDAEARRVKAKLLEIEEPLKAEKARIDDAKAAALREKREAAERKAAERQRIAEAAVRKAEEERRAAIEREQEAERRKLEAERAAIREQERQMAEERRKLEAERAAMQVERDAAERKEREAAEAIERKKREEAEAERKKLEAIAREKAEAEQKPDRVRLRKFIQMLDGLEVPTMRTDWGNTMVTELEIRIGDLCGRMFELLDEGTTGERAERP